jgi:hypothetical protein
LSVLTLVLGLLASLLVATPANAAPTQTHPHGPQLLSSAKVNRPNAVIPPGLARKNRSLSSKPQPVKEIIAARTATSSTWQNSDGSLSVSEFGGPRFYRTSPAAGWQPIDSGLVPVPGRAGWFQSKANSWSAAFGPAGGAERLIIGSTTIGFTPRNVTNAAQAPTGVRLDGQVRQRLAARRHH